MIFPDELTPRLRKAGFGPETPRFLRLLRDAYRERAARGGFGVIDLSGVLRPGETLDGAHPTPEGHAALARRVAADLASLLKRGM
jgi:lysophospholipase L1-like esterase